MENSSQYMITLMENFWKNLAMFRPNMEYVFAKLTDCTQVARVVAIVDILINAYH